MVSCLSLGISATRPSAQAPALTALLVVAAGLRSTGVLDWVGNRLLGSAVDERLHYVAGLYWYNEETTGEVLVNFLGPFDPAVAILPD